LLSFAAARIAPDPCFINFTWQFIDMTKQNKKNEGTSALFRKLSDTPDIRPFMEHLSNGREIPSFDQYISDLCQKSGKIPEQVIKQAAIERTYGHQLFNGTRKPSRDKAIQIAFGLELDLEDTQELLKVTQKSLLYPRIKRDAAIIFCINQRKDILETQGILQTLGLTLLGGG
jgi:hypothetical protein